MNNYKYMFKKLYKINLYSRLYLNNNLLIKKIPKNEKFDSYNEINILNSIESEYIIKIKEYYDDTDFVYIVMDYYPDKDLYDNIKKEKININKDFIKKIIKPIEILHSNNIVHLDLKLENYLYQDSNNYVLIDFQWSKYHEKSYYNTVKIDDNFIYGTPNFMAPELYLQEKYCKASDIYSLGCLLFLAFTRNIYTKENLYLLNNLNPDIKYLIKELLKDDFTKRPSIYDIKNYLN